MNDQERTQQETNPPADSDRAEQIDRVVAVLPAAVDESMRTAIPHLYSPKRAAEFTAAMAAELRRPTRCPDGIAWCDADPDSHADPREHRHQGPEYGITGPYLDPNWTKTLVAFQIAKWDDDEPRLVFQADGTWPDLGLPETDELITGAVQWLTRLIATRRLLAIEVSPNRSTVPFTESDDKQMASAGFDLATKAIDVALARAEGRAGMFRALRNFLDTAEDEQTITH